MRVAFVPRAGSRFRIILISSVLVKPLAVAWPIITRGPGIIDPHTLRGRMLGL